jgi:hypothetical protein
VLYDLFERRPPSTDNRRPALPCPCIVSDSPPIDPRRENGLPPAAVADLREAQRALLQGRFADADAATTRAAAPGRRDGRRARRTVALNRR